MKLALKILNGLITAALILLIAAGSFLGFAARRSGDRLPSVAGHKVLTVISGSMEPTIHTGDIIIVQPLADPAAEVKDGDIITYHAADDAGMLITHRVTGTLLVGGEAVAFGTKGDANESADSSVVTPEQIVGRYRWRIPYFGYVTTFIRQPVGVVLFLIVPGLVLIGLEFRKMWQAVSAEEKARAAKAAQAEGGDGAAK